MDLVDIVLEEGQDPNILPIVEPPAESTSEYRYLNGLETTSFLMQPVAPSAPKVIDLTRLKRLLPFP